jgi:uncharacterized iron-regulated protein
VFRDEKDSQKIWESECRPVEENSKKFVWTHEGYPDLVDFAGEIKMRLIGANGLILESTLDKCLTTEHTTKASPKSLEANAAD